MDFMPRGSPSSAGLNPNAPLFVPQAYRKAESLSDQWRRLVESSAPWFGGEHRFNRSSERRKEEEEEEGRKAVADDDYGSVLPDEDTLFHGYQPYEEEQRHARGGAPASWKDDVRHGLFGPAGGLNLLRVSPLVIRKPN